VKAEVRTARRDDIMLENENRKTIEEFIQNIDLKIAEVKDPFHSRSTSVSQEAEADKRRCVLFSHGSIKFVVPLNEVAEICPLPPMTFLPNLPSWVQGVVSLRGEVISVVDITQYYGWEMGRAATGKWMVVIWGDDKKTAIYADKIIGSAIIDFEQDIERDAQVQLEKKTMHFIQSCRVENEQYCLLLPSELLRESRMNL